MRLQITSVLARAQLFAMDLLMMVKEDLLMQLMLILIALNVLMLHIQLKVQHSALALLLAVNVEPIYTSN